jgi:signal transduction histidine kinase
MRIRRFRRPVARLLAALLAAALLSPGLALPAAAAGEPRVVRAGYFYNGDFMHKDDGAYAGYDVEYYYTLAGFAGWEVRFTEYDSLRSALAALERGEIDVMSGLSRTPERTEKFLVSAQKMCTAHIAVQTRADDDRFTAGDPSTMTGLTCGILRGSNVVSLYSDWCRENNLVPHVVEYDSLDQRNAALAARQVDAIAGGSTVEGAQKIAEFPSLDLYFMFSRSRPDLKEQLDRAMGILSLQDPTYSEHLFSTYFPVSRSCTPSFSAGEKAFISAHPSLRVAVLRDDAPFSAVEKDGSATGILPDYYDHLSQVTGIRFTCVPCASNGEACTALAAGEVDLIGKFENDIYRANQRRLLLTVPFLQMNLVQITRAGTGAVRRAAVPQCNSRLVVQALRDAGSAVTAEERTNSAASFAALKSGRADAVICTQPAATWLLNRNRASDYMVSSFSAGTWDASCALPRGEDGNTLRSILNKTIAVDGGYIQQLLTSETLQDSANLAGYFDTLPVSVLAVAVIVAGVLLTVAAAALVILLRRRQAERQLEAQRLELSAAQEANRARHAFFGAVSHDMRTPLNGILGFTDLALRSDDPVRVRDCLTKIRTSGTILSGLVNDTLVMSRIESGKYQLRPVRCRTAEVLGEVLESVRVLAAEKGVLLRDNAASLRSRTVLADPLSLQKIVLNLLTNAVKFTPPGGTVTLTCTFDPPQGPRPVSVLTVADTGSGISPEFLPHVFEPFAQENAANADTSGSGMGLSIVRSIVDALGGTIDVRSEKGRGTVFTVRLQLQETEEAPSPAPAAAQPDPAVLRGRRALVCEDNALNREILETFLRGFGMEVTCAENGRRGVELFSASAPGWFDAVLLDLRMPVMDGKTAARAIRALPRPDARSVLIFAVSADAYPENVQECLAAGMTGHIAKPVDPQELCRRLADALGKAGS